MAGLIVLTPDVDWSASGGLFDWTLEFLIPRLSDGGAAARLQEIVDKKWHDIYSNVPYQAKYLLERGKTQR